jgi:prepilin-type N-terminal cleavage/methylation domain-containing protein
MAQNHRRGFSIIEMLIVIGVIVILLTLLMAPLFDQATRTSYIAVCSSNLNQISMARMSFENDVKRPLAAGEWATLVPYFSGQDGVLICPEDAEIIGGDPSSYKIGIATRNPKIDTNISYYITFAISPLNVHMSQEQYDQVQWAGSEGVNFFNNNPWYDGYVEGANPDLYYVIFEDIVRNGVAAGDMDFEDIHFKVEILGDEAVINTKRGQAGYRHFFFDGNGNNLIGPNQPIPTSWVTVAVPLGPASYGMNLYSEDVNDGHSKLFAIDYESTVVKPETWSNWDSVDGVPGFARHYGDKLNAVNYDGSVKRMDPAEINPEYVSNDLIYWQP